MVRISCVAMLCATTLLPGVGLAADPVTAQPVPLAPAPHSVAGGNALAVDAGGGHVVMLPAAAASIFAADPKVAEAKPASARSLFIFGVAPGRTTIAAMDAAGLPIVQYEVTVRPSAYGATEASAALARLLPNNNLRIDTLPTGMSVSGNVATPADAERAISIVKGYSAPNQSVENHISVQGPTQVNLRVRFIEVSRTLTRQLGLNWQALGNIGRFAVAAVTNYSTGNITSAPSALGVGYQGAVNVNSVIDALAQDDLISILAEPNLTAQSGETASFLAGGEFPIPVAQQNNQTTIEFKQYGISLSFVPTVLAPDHISMRVRPEVSQLTTQGAVQLAAGNSSIQVPALTVRRADTTVELGSGQSFAIAGLYQQTRNQTGSGIPGIGEMPVIGALAHSDAFQRADTELVIVVTPYIVRPTSDPKDIHVPEGATAPPASDLQRVLLFRQYAGTAGSPPPAVPGDVGFVIR